MDNKILHHPLTIAILPLVIAGLVGYFGWVKGMENDHTVAAQKFNSLQDTLSTLNNFNSRNHKRLTELEQKYAVFESIPPRVVTLEDSVNSLNISIAKQDTKLDYIQSDIREIKDILKGK